MSMEEETTPSRRGHRAAPRLRGWAALGRRLRWFGVTFLVLEALYLIAGNLFLTFGLARLVTFDPDVVEMRLESPFTLWPGTAHVRRYHLRSQDTAIQWVLEVEDADLTVDLLDLFQRKFHATRVRAKQCSFRLRRKLDPVEARSPLAAALPPIAGFADPPMVMIGPPTAHGVLWRAQLEDVVTGVQEIWVDEWRLLGPGQVTGGFYFDPTRFIQVGPVTLDVHAGELRIADGPVLRGLDMGVASTVGMIDVRGPLESAVRQISISGRVDAELTGVDFLRLYLSPASPVQLEGGGGAVHVDLRLAHGVALPPTAIRVESDRLVIAGAKLDAVLSLVAEARVLASAAGPTASGEVRVRHAALLLQGSNVAPPVVEALLARFRGLPHDLAGPMEIEHTHLDMTGRVPDLGVFLPPPEKGLAGRASLRAEADLDRAFHGAGVVEAHSDRVQVSTAALDVAGAISAKVGFDGADFERRHLRLLPSYVVADHLTVTREGRAHPGGSLRVDLGKGSVRSGLPRDFELAVAARFADLGWLTFRKDDEKGGSSASARAGALEARLVVPRPAALFDGPPEDAAITGSIGVSASGEGRFRDVSMRGDVSATTVIEGLDLGRRTLRLRKTRVVARDVEIVRGHDRSPGWWASIDLSALDGKAAGPVSVETHAEVRCKSGEPLLAALASAGTIPKWVGAIFPMNDLSASGDVSRRAGVLDLRMSIASSSAQVRARLHDLGGAMDGAVFVETALLSVGVELAHGKSHLHVFAGEDWLKRHMGAANGTQAIDLTAAGPSR
jgi:hypothetical protein